MELFPTTLGHILSIFLNTATHWLFIQGKGHLLYVCERFTRLGVESGRKQEGEPLGLSLHSAPMLVTDLNQGLSYLRVQYIYFFRYSKF